MKWAAAERLLARINALSKRDRLAMLAGGLALVGAVEFQVVLPLRGQRMAAEAQQQGPDALQVQAQQVAAEAAQAKLESLKQEWAKRQQSPVHHARASAPQAMFAELRQNLALAGVQIVSLHALADEVPQSTKSDAAAPAEEAASDAAVPADAAASDAAAQPAKPAPTIYRHRAELRVSGPLSSVMQVISRLEHEDQTMRLERVLVSATEQADGQVVATFTLVTISEEQSWLEM